jgi:drug/metabolite transporter (DMT)-like permease
MLEIFQYWQTNLALAIVLFVIMHQNYRILGQKVNDTSNLAVITGAIGSVIFILLIPFFKFTLPDDWRVYGLLLLSTVFYTMQDLLKFKSYKYLDVSVLTIVFQVSKIFFIAYGLLFFKERLTVYEWVGIICILGGIFLVTFKKKTFKLNKRVWLVVGAALAFSTAMTVDVGISRQFNVAFYLLMIYAIPAMAIFISKKKTFSIVKNDFFIFKGSVKVFLVAGVTSALGMLFYLLALRQGQVSIVAPLSSITVLLNVLAGYIFLKEKKDPLKRIFAAALVIGGVFLLV